MWSNHDEFTGPQGHVLESLWFEFGEEFESLVQFLNVLKIVNDAYEVQVEIASDLLDPENSDMGDVYWKATQLLKLDPYDAANHIGLMLLARGTGLYETFLGRIAAKFFTEPQEIVYKNDKTWTRTETDDFFGTCLARPVRPWRGPMKWIAQLRDLYAHGYGEPLSENNATSLARELWMLARADEGPTPEESRMGFGESAHLFGPFDRYSPKTGIEALAFSKARFSLSPLATLRLLAHIRRAMSAVFEASSWWVREDLSPENSAFVRNWEKKNSPGQA